MDSRLRGNPLGITVIHTGVLFLNQPNLPCLGPFFQAHLHKWLTITKVCHVESGDLAP